jgi:hypothetical protein
MAARLYFESTLRFGCRFCSSVKKPLESECALNLPVTDARFSLSPRERAGVRGKEAMLTEAHVRLTSTTDDDFPISSGT